MMVVNGRFLGSLGFSLEETDDGQNALARVVRAVTLLVMVRTDTFRHSSSFCSRHPSHDSIFVNSFH
jgi:hypothetical protein